MKKITFSLALIMLSAMAVSCGLDIGPEDGPIPTDGYTALTTAGAVYYGDSQETGTGYFELGLATADGESLSLQLFGDLADDGQTPALKVGEYKVGEGEALTFIAGEEGSSFADKAIERGTFTIAQSGKTYSIVTDLYNADGDAVKCKYSGAIIIVDKSVSETGDDVIAITNASAIYYGDYVEYTTNGYFELNLSAGDDTSSKTLSLQIFGDLLEEGTVPTLQAGEYKIGTGEILTFAAGTYDVVQNRVTGSVFKQTSNGRDVVWLVSEGTVTIEVNGAEYTVTANLTDDFGKAIVCQYEGAITVTDRSVPVVFESTVDYLMKYEGNKEENDCGKFGMAFTGEVDGTTYTLMMASVFSDLAEDNDNAVMTSHEYTINDSYEKYTAIGLVGADMYSTLDIMDETSAMGYAVESGSFNLTVTPEGIYTIDFNIVKTNFATGDKTKFKATYEGPMVFENNAPKERLSTLDNDVLDFTSFDGGKLTYFGPSPYDSSLSNFQIDLFGTGVFEGNGIEGSGQHLFIVMDVPGAYTNEIPAGTYEFANSGDDLVLYPGRIDEYGFYQDCWYTEYDNGTAINEAPLVAGSMIVERDDANYKITFNFEDDTVTPYAYWIQGVYEGTLDFSQWF